MTDIKNIYKTIEGISKQNLVQELHCVCYCRRKDTYL